MKNNLNFKGGTIQMRKYSKLFVLLISLTLVAGALLTGCGGDSDDNGDDAVDETFELRMATVVSPPHPWIEMAEFFAEEVEARTDGNVTVRLYHSSTLGDDESTIDEMRLGTVDFVIGGVANAIPFIPEFQITGFPYLFEDLDHFRRATAADSPVFQRYQEIYEDRNLGFSLLALAGGGTRTTSTNFGPVNTPEDLAGVEMRLPANPLEVRIWEEIGTLPTTLPWGEIYSGLQAGLVNAFESTISGYYGSALYEVAPYKNLTQHQIMISHFSMSDLTIQELPEEYLEIIREVAIEAGDLGTDMGEQYDEEVLETLIEEHGVTVTESDIDSFMEVVMPLHDELAEDIDVVDILEMIRDLQ